MTLKSDIDQLAADAALMHQVVHGGPTTVVTTLGGPVRSVAKLIADQDAGINAAAAGVLSQATTQAAVATTQNLQAASAKDQALAARDLAVAAWSVSTAPAEILAPIMQTIHSGSAVQTFIYDTRKDSDKGAWRSRCSAMSWCTEATPAAGIWLMQAANETAARNFGNAAGNYFQNSTDGKFYALNSVAGVTEIFRGARKDFPEVVAIVIEASRVIMYDLTRAGCPMWMVFVENTWLNMVGEGAISCVYMLNGIMAVGCGVAGYDLYVVDFTDDTGLQYGAAGMGTHYSGNIAKRNAGLDFDSTITLPALISRNIMSVAMTVLPDAPIDPATGIQIPTIAVGTAGGVSVIKHDGTVVNSSQTNNVESLSISGDRLFLSRLYGVGAPSRYVSLAGISDAFSPVSMVYSWDVDMVRASGNNLFCRLTSFGVAVMRPNLANAPLGIQASISNTFNTGWQVGYSKMACLADTYAETIAAPELVTNGTFPGTGNVNGWTLGVGTINNNGVNDLDVTSSAVSNVIATQPIVGLIPGKLYRLSFDKVFGTGAVSIFMIGGALPANYTSGAGTVVRYFTATATTDTLAVNAIGANSRVIITNVSLMLVEADRSAIGFPLKIIGSITKTPVGAGNSLVAYSGFSAFNYLSQPYNSALDFGAGDFCYKFWAAIGSAPAIGSCFFQRGVAVNSDETVVYVTSSGAVYGRIKSGNVVVSPVGAFVFGPYNLIVFQRISGVVQLWVNGVLVNSAANVESANQPATLNIGIWATNPVNYAQQIALFNASATAASADQIGYIYETERHLFEPGNKCVIDGTSTAVTTLAADEITDLLHVGTSWGRSTFKGLVRVESESTSNGMAKSYSAHNGAVVQAGSAGVKVSVPSRILREKQYPDSPDSRLIQQDFTATASQTAFVLPPGLKPAANGVSKNGSTLRFSISYTTAFDGFRWVVNLVSGAALNDWISILCTKEKA